MSLGHPTQLFNLILSSPELIGYPDPVTNKLEAHNTWIVSLLERLSGLTIANFHKANADRDYYAWIKEKGYGVIDVNIPKHITRELVSLTALQLLLSIH